MSDYEYVPGCGNFPSPAANYPDLVDYHEAIAGVGPHAYNWRDKPHRLVYDLTRMVAELRDQQRIAQPRFPETFCSSCGKALGPGDAGVSHCGDHK